MRHALTRLLLSLTVLLLCVQQASARAVVGPENRVGGFENALTASLWDEGAAMPDYIRDAPPCGYELAPDVCDGPNLYAYVQQNPWTHWDPEGLFTDDQRDQLDEANKNASDIIRKFDRKGKPVTPGDIKRDDFTKDMFGFGTGWNPLTKHGKLRGQYPGESDDDIALAESARRNAMRAKVLLAQNGLLSKNDVVKLQLNGMATLADATIELGLALAPYSRLAGALKPVIGLTGEVAGAGSATSAKIVSEAQAMMKSPQMARLQKAFGSGEGMTVNIGGRPVQLVPDGPFSGFTNFRGGGFALGQDAFTSPLELQKTILHELYRLNNSALRAGGAAGGSMAAEETAAAAAFAERYAGQLGNK